MRMLAGVCLVLGGCWLGSAVVGCSAELDSHPGDGGQPATHDPDPTDGAGGAPADGLDAPADEAVVEGPPPETPPVGTDDDRACADGLSRTVFDREADGVVYDEKAPDFTARTVTGTFALSERWTGCSSFVVVLHHAGYREAADVFWESSVSELIDDSAPGVHYVFVSVGESDPEARQRRVLLFKRRIDAYLETRPEALRLAWADRLHYVIDEGRDIALIDAVLRQNVAEVHFTIDRRQRLREGHSVSYYTPRGWEMQLGNTRYWAKYYDAQYRLDERLARERGSGTLVHRVADAQEIRATEPFVWSLPSAEAIADYTRLEVDLRVDCPGEGHPFRDTCGEWDTVGSLFLCSQDDCTGPRRRVIKWITPYSAPGRWLIDITPELVTLGAGGAVTFVAAHGDNNVGPYTYKYTVDFRFSAAPDGLRPFALQTLIPRGNHAFAGMAGRFGPFEIQPPDGTRRVELYARISGHGAEPVAHCAEFCTFTHTFFVNDTPFRHVFEMEDEDRCAQRVAEGVTPNQGGTWHFDRSSWCPGWVIEEWRADLTAAMNLAGVNSIVHSASVGGGEPPGGNMDARVELVYYR